MTVENKELCPNCGSSVGDHKPSCGIEMWAVVMVQYKHLGGGGWCTIRGTSLEEIKEKAKNYMAKRVENIVGFSLPYQISESKEYPDVWDTTPPKETFCLLCEGKQHDIFGDHYYYGKNTNESE